MIIQHNIMAINSHRQLTVNNSNLAKNLEKLSSGYRINKAADDAAGLAISEKMRAQITGLNRAILNAQDGASLIQTAEGALTEVHSMLNRMVELATQSANGTIQADDRQKIESELEALKGEIDRISQATNFNGIALLNGDLATGDIPAVPTVPEVPTVPAEAATMTASNGPAATATLVTNVALAVNSAPTTAVPTELENVSGTVSVSANAGVISFTVGTATVSYDLNDLLSDAAASTAIDIDLGSFGDYKLTFNSSWADASGEQIADLASAIADAYGTMGSVTAAKAEVPGTAEIPGTATIPGTGVGLTMQVGDTADTFNMITVSVDDMSSAGLGIASISMADQSLSAAALDKIKAAIEKVSVNRGNLGALQNRLEHTINNLGVTSENMTAAESRIRDVDMAKEMMAFTKNNVLSQAAQAMLAQANQQPQQVLQLLR